MRRQPNRADGTNNCAAERDCREHAALLFWLFVVHRREYYC
jgi:hypothetical protein